MPATRAFAMLLRSFDPVDVASSMILGITHKEREEIEDSADGQHPSI